MLIWPIPALLSPFVGMFYSLSTLPVRMRHVSHLLPPSFVFAGIRTIVRGGTSSALTLLLGIALSLVYFVGAYFIFLEVYRKVARTGLLARCSAEDAA